MELKMRNILQDPNNDKSNVERGFREEIDD